MPNVIDEGVSPFYVGINGKTTLYRPGDVTTTAHEGVMRSGSFVAQVGNTATGQIKIVPRDQVRGTFHPNGVRLQVNGKETAFALNTAFTPAAGVLAALTQAGIVTRNVTT